MAGTRRKQPQLIVMEGSLDRERLDSYDLTIKVQDGTSPPLLVVPCFGSVLDTNDNAPKLTAVYEAELSENSPIGHSSHQVEASIIRGDPLYPGSSATPSSLLYPVADFHLNGSPQPREEFPSLGPKQVNTAPVRSLFLALLGKDFPTTPQQGVTLCQAIYMTVAAA